jgi:hypothetical protein
MSLWNWKIPGWRFSGSTPDESTDAELKNIEDMLRDPSNRSSALRMLQNLLSTDAGVKQVWALGVQAFEGIRYDYTPPPTVRSSLKMGRDAIEAGDSKQALKIAKQLVTDDSGLKQGWELGLATFG